MTRWRSLAAAEQEHDRRLLATFLRPQIAAAIAALPVVDVDSWGPWEQRAQAWLWRTEQLLRSGENR